MSITHFSGPLAYVSTETISTDATIDPSVSVTMFTTGSGGFTATLPTTGVEEGTIKYFINLTATGGDDVSIEDFAGGSAVDLAEGNTVTALYRNGTWYNLGSFIT